MRRLVQDFIRACTTCQRYKSEHLHPAGLLMPLPIPQAVWTVSVWTLWRCCRAWGPSR
jgi:hypothetical protein